MTKSTLCVDKDLLACYNSVRKSRKMTHDAFLFELLETFHRAKQLPFPYRHGVTRVGGPGRIGFKLLRD